jgi:tetratricopeptide (TPR) repeat protein/tRNA A-37 threonylcarbamoyl transferase component Bud32
MDWSYVPASEREQRLNEVLAAYYEAVEAGQPPDREALLARHPDLADDLAAFLNEQQKLAEAASPLRSVLGIAADTPRPGDTASGGSDAPGPAAPRTFGDYELLEELGRGGMGVVYKARQPRLNRLVALKLLPADGPAVDARRFRNEAETVALLDHPHIVPIYEVGERDGRLYFSMKLVEGDSLTELIKRQGPAVSRDQQRWAARLVAAVARAVHHAHQRGVLHRDLKPSNVLLDQDGRPHVMDFGLAKRLAEDSSLTQSGALVGTPSYMAPEQAQGKKSSVTTATDVYGLGAVLYWLLTGKPPFQGDSVLETLEQVKRCEPARPGSSQPGVDRDLETICLKCLQKEPARRFASAEMLAEDLERWLAGEPVRARRASSWERSRKWVRRRPALAALLAVSALSAAALVAGLFWHNSQLQDAAEREQRQAGRATRQRDMARRAVNDMYTQVAERWLARQPRLQPVQREFLEKALRYFQEVADADDASAERLELGRAYLRVGKIQFAFGAHPEAEQAYRRAADLAQALAAESPGETEARGLVGQTWGALSELLVRVGDNPQAEQAAGRAITALEQLVGEGLASPADQARLADAYLSLGHALERSKGRVAAVGTYRKALRIREMLVGRAPADPEQQIGLASCCQDLAAALYEKQEFKLAQEALERGVLHAERAAKADPASGAYQGKLASLRLSLGIIYCKTSQPGAEKLLRRALDAQSRLAAEYPDFPRYREELANTYNVLAIVCDDNGRPKEAEAAYRESITIKKRLAADSPAVPYYELDLVDALNNLTELLRNAGRGAEAAQVNHDARRHAERLVKDFPGVVDHQKRLGRVHQRRAELELTAGRPGAAAAEWGRALEVCTHPDIRDGAAQFLTTCPDPKYRDLARAVALAKENVRIAPENFGYWETLGQAQYRAGRAPEAVQAFEQARRAGSTNPEAQLLLAMSHWQAGAKDAARRHYASAVQLLENEKKPDAETPHVRAEAAQLLGVKEAPQPKGPQAKPGTLKAPAGSPAPPAGSERRP